MRYVLFLGILMTGLAACDLERIPDFQIGDADKFNTAIGGSANEFPSDILANTDGSIVVVGKTQSFTADKNNQAYIAKVDKEGVLVKQNHFGYAGDDAATAVVASADGGYVIVGTTNDPLTFNTNILVLKVNAALEDDVWQFSYGSEDSTELAFGIIPTGAGDFLIGYSSTHVSGSTAQHRFMRINANGARVSDKLSHQGSYTLTDMIKTTNGQIAACGYEYGQGTASYTVRFDADGDWIWDQVYPMTDVNYSPLYGIVEMQDNSLVVAGSTLGPDDHDFLLLTYSSIGMFVDVFDWGGANADELLGVTRSQDNEIVCVGYSRSFSGDNEIYISKRKRTDGSEIWTKHFGESWVSGTAVTLCPDGGFALATGQNAANADIIIVKTDANGEYQ